MGRGVAEKWVATHPPSKKNKVRVSLFSFERAPQDGGFVLLWFPSPNTVGVRMPIMDGQMWMDQGVDVHKQLGFPLAFRLQPPTSPLSFPFKATPRRDRSIRSPSRRIPLTNVLVSLMVKLGPVAKVLVTDGYMYGNSGVVPKTVCVCVMKLQYLQPFGDYHLYQGLSHCQPPFYFRAAAAFVADCDVLI